MQSPQLRSVEDSDRAFSISSQSDASDILDLRDDEGWEDAEPEENQDRIVSLLDDQSFPDVSSMLGYCKEKYDFDLLSTREKFSLDFYGTIKLVNFIRNEVKSGRPISSSVSESDFNRDEFLKPVMEDDALLFSLDDLPDVSTPESARPDHTGDNEKPANLLARIEELEAELRNSQSQFEQYRNTVEETLDARWLENSASQDAVKEKTPDAADGDNYYFSSYSYNGRCSQDPFCIIFSDIRHIDIHETMLKDTIRTDAYRDFIYNHKHLIAGKVVLDVGCGTGILSLFCARAGARQVIAVDNSAIIDKARENVFNNGFADTIVCLRGKIEEVSLPVKNVDIIVSEWMGYCLLYEAMLDSVIWARDKYLKPDGLMIPSHVNLWLAPVADPDYVADRFAFWRDVYGFDMKAMQPGMHDDTQVLHMPLESLCATPVPFMQFDLHRTAVCDVVFRKEWEATLTKDIDALDGFIIWFDMFFEKSQGSKVPFDARAEQWSVENGDAVAFTTGPFGKETHWRQAVMFVNNLKESMGGTMGHIIKGNLEYAVPTGNSRALDITISWTENSGQKQSQLWKMR